MKPVHVKIRSIKHITHDVLQIITGKPENLTFTPGQAADISINRKGWEDELRPFTFTSLPVDNFLQFTIKTYPSRQGVTNQLLDMRAGDELILHEVFGAIAYKGEGVFIAGGAGVTPFISIFRHLKSRNEVGGNKLIFANKTSDDIILALEFEELLGRNFVNILSDEDTAGYAHGLIDEKFLSENITNFHQQFYVCGPPPMIDAVLELLEGLGVPKSAITMEDM